MESAYDRKFEEMKKYIPFLERMIHRLESTSISSSNPRQAQLDKIRSLRDLLLDKKKRMKMDNLLKCEQVLVNLYAKVEQRDTLPGIKNASDPLFPSNASTEAQNIVLDTARNKLKSVVNATKCKLPENDPDTLPEIAPACETEVVCTPGSKEPALFQRRPHRNSRSPMRKSPARDSTEKKSPQKTVPKRNYTRVLVSPEPSSRRWTPHEDSPSDKPLFSRRSPRKSPKIVSPQKREKKKSSKSGKTKSKDLNITLKVPEDSLDSLNTGDILSRIIKCPDNDVDIDTLRDLRTQILGELKLSGAKDDISDLLLKSYKKKKRSNKRKTEVEEGELSDSESEAIQSVYGSLVVVDKDKNKITTKASGSADKEKQARKIQIKIISDKEEATDKKKEVTEVIDFEMFDLENKNEEIKTAKDPNRKENENVKKVTAQSLDKQLSKQMKISTPKNKSEDLLTIDVEDDDDLNKIDVTNAEGKDSDSSYIDISSSDTESQPPENKNTNKESDAPFKANFYNENREAEKENPAMTSVDIDSTNKDARKDVPESLTQEESKTSDDVPVLSETNAPTQTPPTKSDETVNTNETSVSSKEVDTESEIPKQTEEIPLLNTEPVVPAPAKKDTVSEIDILQALKNEILSESIAIPGADAATPLLHQPKVTKVASAQEIMSKKRISIEKYKEKSVKATKTKPLFLNDPNISHHSDSAKKTSLKLTKEEQQRFNFLPLPLDSSDEDENETPYSVDDIYADLAPKSPENSDEITTSCTTPIIIPIDPVKPTIVATNTDVDMRTMIPKLSPNTSKPAPPPTGIFPQTSSRNTSSGERRNENEIEPRRAPLDPRVRRDLKQPIGKDSPNAFGTPRHTGISTPSRNPNMTPNSRSFEMTPSRQTFDLEDSSNRKHVYAPFPTFDSRDQRDQQRETSGPRWEPNELISERRNTRWDSRKDSDLRETRWEERDQRGRSSRDSSSDYHKSTYDADKYHEKREDYSYSRMDCPRTPVHPFGRSDCPTTPTPSFGRSECPTTPIHPFGRTDCPTTPSHPFGRSDCPTTPIHPFGRSDCPLTPSHPFGRSDTPMTSSHPFGRPESSSHSYGRTEAPMTPSHPFGRSDGPMTPSHPFGRSDAPMTPSHPFGRSDAPMTPSHPFGRSDAPITPIHPFGRSEAPMTPSHPFGRSELGVAPMTPSHPFGRSDYQQSSGPKVIKDPRLNRPEHESKSRKFEEDRDRGYYKDRQKTDLSTKTYNNSESYRQYREQSVGRNDRNKFNRERTPRRETSVGRSLTREYENERLYTRDRSSGRSNEYSFENEKRARNYNDQPRRDFQRGRSVGRSETADDRFQRSGSRGPSDNRNLSKPINDNTLSVKPQTGMSFTIDTSVNSTFQEFLNGKGLQVFDYSFDSRRQRATSVGRTLAKESCIGRNFRECSVGRTLSKPAHTTIEQDTSGYKRMVNFVRARSMGRELIDKTEKSFTEIKADLKSFKPNYTPIKGNKNIELVKKSNYRDPRSRKDQYEKQVERKNTPPNKKPVYSPRKNSRDPRVHRDPNYVNKSKNRYEDKRKNYGIVYSSDNIAKGTILGSGFGVRNYKIPKIKKPVEEKEPVKENTVDLKDGDKKDTKKEKISEKPKSIEVESKHEAAGVKVVKESHIKGKTDLKNVKDHEEKKSEKTSKIINEIAPKPQREKNKRMTRRSKVIESVEENIPKVRKPKKAVIDSDSEPDNIEQETKKTEVPEISTTVEMEAKDETLPDTNDDLLNNSFGIDDLDIFPDNLTANPVLDSISALIADLDNDIDTTKGEDFSKALSFDNMFDSIDSPEGNMDESLKDISQVIENIDQITQENGSNRKEITNLTPEINVVENSGKQVSNNSEQPILAQDSKKSDSCENTDAAVKHTSVNVGSPQKQSDKISNAAPDANIQDSTVHNSTQNDVNANHQEPGSVNNESVVSTTENNQVLLKKPDELNEDRSSTPDSTLDTSPTVLNKAVEEKGLPDSTNEKREMHPDVSSTRDQSETSTKNVEVSSQKDNSVNSIGNLLLMLQDKHKIKELLSMLGEAQSGDNEKIKKKLEKLSEIVSDDEDTNDGANDDKTEKCQQDESKEIIYSQHEESKETDLNMDDTKIDAEVSLENTDAITMKSDAVKLFEPENNLCISSELQDTEQLEANKPTTKGKKPKKPLKRGRKARAKNNKNSLPGKRVTRSGTANKLVNKPKKPSRELRQLQESIKEMFIKDDVLNATGIRMCRLSKLVDEKIMNQEDESDPQSVDPKPVVVLEKFKDTNIEVKSESKLKKKPKPKSKTKSPHSDTDDSVTLSNLKDTKTFTALKYKPGPKSKTKNLREDSDPYSFDDSISEATTAQTSEQENESETEDDSLASLKSSESSEVLSELKKKPKRKRGRAWQSGIIKKKTKRKKNEPKQDEQLPDESSVIPCKDIKIQEKNCFTDKSYCFLKNVTEYPCRLCQFSGTEIVKHYKTDHPHTEIPLSRMSVAVAREAVEQCEDINFQAISKMPTEKYICRFCFEEFTNNSHKKNIVLEEFFWHVVSMHTGEYKMLCSECVNVTRCPFNLDIPPPPKDLRGQLIGYICGKCNFTQISLENLKTHVIVRHNDEQTAVYTINLAVMSKKTIQALMKRCNAQDQARELRSLRSKTSATDKSEHDDHNEESDADAMSDVENATKMKSMKKDQKSKTLVQSKLSFESDDNTSEAASNEVKVKTEDDENYENNEFETTGLNEPVTHSDTEQEQASSDILDCPHFKIIYASNGSKEYVCCINGVDNHYKTHLLISMKKHVQLKHSEIWDGYCFICKVIVMPQGGHRFKECLQHMLDKHMDNFPVLQQAQSETIPQTETAPGNKRPVSEISDPTRERTASPHTYINLRPLTDLMAPVNKETDEVLPKIQSVVSLGSTETHEDSTPTSKEIVPVFKCPTAIEKVAPKSEEPYKYEEMQAEVMSKKHLAILETMLSEDKLVQIFKCAGRFCSFTTDSADASILHASTHQRIGGENTLLCAYCDYDCNGDAIDLVMHVFKLHGPCRYVCGLCFYRAVASQLVLAHIHRVHGGAQPIVLETATVSPVADDVVDMLPREVAVQHYLCPENTRTCKFKTYTQGKFIEHLTKHAAPYLCHHCSQESSHPTELLHHLKTHGLKLYQCTFCVEGGDTEGDFLAHSSSRHPTRQPQAYLRIITTSKDDGSKTMVLPLAKLNKAAVPTRLVTPQNTSISPAREAEKALEMEKLIAAMPTVTDDKRTRPKPKTYSRLVINIPSKQPPPQIVNEKQQPSLRIINEKEPPSPQITYEEGQPSTQIVNEEGQSSLQITYEKGQPSAQIVNEKEQPSPQIVNEKGQPSPQITYKKGQPSPQIAKENETAVTNLDVIEQPRLVTPPPSTSTQELSELLPLTPVLKTEPIDESTAKDLSNSTIICLDSDEEDTGEQPDRSQQPEPVKENVIDLSDDYRSSSAADKYKKLDPLELYKCTCQILFKSLAGFKRHILSCYYGKSKYDCAHCIFNTSNLEEYFNHYNIDHSATQAAQKPVHFCGVCNRMDKSLHVLKNHMKKEHKFMFFTVTSKSDGNYVVSGTATRNRPGPKRKLSGDPATESSPKRIRYGAQDLNKLPQKPILDELAYCSECEFSTKVRLNLVRHIQQHADNQLVPQTAPVNPVPHLETNEKHFDKMINLASSSSEIARVAEKSAPSVTLHIPPEAATRYPKYVPDRQRHTCGAKGCSYISVDEAMLKCHWETLHAGSNDFHCVHCPPYQHLDTSKPLTASRIIAHLKMHDIRLYACSACTYYHYLRKVLEKHLSEVHKGSGHIMVVREESTGASSPVGIPQVSNTAPTMDLKPWKCGLCAFKSMLRPEVIEHCSKTHSSKMQFKCPVCPFRTSTLENVTKHKTKSHPENNEDVFYYYYREGSIPDEKDGTPRWMKQRQKMGNPDTEVKTEEPESAEQSVLASLLQPILPATTSYNINLNIVKEEVVDPVIEESMEALCKKYGEICDPNGLKFKCPLCKLVTEDNKEAMQSHLYEELQYRKWACSICCYKAFHKTGLHEHMVTEHRQSRAIEPIELDADTRIERWVNKVLDHQAALIETNKSNLARQKIQVEKPSTSTPAKAVEKTSEPAPRPAGEKETELLVQAFGQLGAPNNADFCCPKCGYQTGEERVMKDHLEIELNKIRWRCSGCWENSQNYHEAQLHSKTCKSSRPGQAVRPVEAIRDPAVRAAWLAAVIRTQKQNMKQAPAAEPESPMDDIITGPLENSLLVVRYEERVPTPEEEMLSRRKRPAPASIPASPDSDDDDERLVIDEPSTDDADTPKKHEGMTKKCIYCPFVTNYKQQLEHHILRHYNLKPMQCCHCEETCYYSSMDSHNAKTHPHLPKKFKKTQVPSGPPPVLEITYKARKRSSSSDELPKRDPKTPTKEEPKKDERKLICLVCERAFSESESALHIHDKPTYFAKKGEVVVKCCICLSLFPKINLMQEHNKQCHPNTPINYAYFKINHNNREILQCGHCSKRFKFFRDLKIHHNVVHSALQLKYETRSYYPGAYDFECETESKGESSKVSESTSPQDRPVRAAKRVARKSTTKLPNRTVARKSTTKLPFYVYSEESDSESEYSYYGNKPASLNQFENVTTRMPIFNTVISLEKFSEILKINPVVLVKDCKK